MRRTVLADTGPLYAALDPDDRYHQRAQEEIRHLNREGRRVAVLYPTLLESYSLILYKLGLPVAHGWLAEVSGQALLLNPSPEDYQQARHLPSQFRDQRRTLFDAVLAVVSRRLATPVWTYDHHFDSMRVGLGSILCR